jgi:DNA invertase Pin-like site-specific DNA recombinase
MGGRSSVAVDDLPVASRLAPCPPLHQKQTATFFSPPPEQASGDSYRRQSELSNRYTEEHGLSLDTSLSLCDLGVSGYTGENRCEGALALFLKAVETGMVPVGSFLLVESLDRLSRDTMSEQMSLFIGLINSGLTVVTLAVAKATARTPSTMT